MELSTILQRGPRDRALPPQVFVPIRKAPRRPKISYRLKIDGPEEARVVRRRGLGVYLLTADVPTRFHYPMKFPPVLFVDRRLVGLIDSPLRVVPFRAVEMLREPPFEALVTMMLRVDEIAARVMLVRNPRPDRDMLTRLIIGERLEKPATLLRFQQFVPSLSIAGPQMPISAIREQDRKNPG